MTVRDRSYRLVGAVEHVGRSLSSGHYLSYRRQAGGLWRALNDDGVSNQASGLRHGTILTSQELAGRQLYVCVYALDALPSRPRQVWEVEATRRGSAQNGDGRPLGKR